MIAEACSLDPCNQSDRFSYIEPAHAHVATDGVLVFEVSRDSHQLTDAEALAYVTATVTDASNQELPGALEVVDGVFLWRPDAALPAGAELTVELVVDNDAIDDRQGCGSETEPMTFTVTEGPLPALTLPEHELVSEYAFFGERALDAFACCDGAYPYDGEGPCGGDEIVYDDGLCVSTRGTGMAIARVQLDEGLAPEIAASIRVELLVDGERVAHGHAAALMGEGPLSSALDHAFDARVRVVSLVDGAQIESEPRTIDGGRPDDLGAREADFAAALESACDGSAYVCELMPTERGMGWNADACEPIGNDDPDGSSTGGTDSGGTDSGGTAGHDDDGDTGQGCRVGGTTPVAAWMLVLGLAARLRRRR